MNIPFVSFRPMERELDAQLRAAFERVYERSWYIEGEEDAAFEKAFAAFCGAEHCVGCGNGLDALMLSLKALGVGEGDEVLVPSNTYIATALAVTYTGAVPVFVEPGKLLGAISVSGPSLRFSISNITRILDVLRKHVLDMEAQA